MADTLWCGNTANKLYKQAGFTSTLSDSVDVSAVSLAPTGITSDLANTIWGGDADERIYKQAGFTSTMLDSFSTIDAGGAGNFGCSCANNDVIWVSDSLGKLLKQEGFSVTVKDSFSIFAIDASPNDISWDGTNTLWTGIVEQAIYKQAGFTATLLDSIHTGPIEAYEGVGWDGTNVLMSGFGKIYKFDGFSATVLDSFLVSGIDTLSRSVEDDSPIIRGCVPAVGCLRNRNRVDAARLCRGDY